MAPPPPPDLTAGARVAVALAGLVVLYGIYSTVGVLQVEHLDAMHTLPTPLDRWVPFQPVWVLAYLWLVPQAIVPLLVIEDRRALRRGVLAYLGVVMAGLPFWLWFPVTVPRAPVPVDDLFTWGVALTRWIDPPTNCFPSMHVAESFLAALVVRRCDRALGRAMLVVAALIWWSTVALDQHWMLDGLAGFALAVVADAVAFGWRPLPAEALRAGPRRRLWSMVALYAALVGIAGAPWWFDWVDPATMADPAWAARD